MAPPHPPASPPNSLPDPGSRVDRPPRLPSLTGLRFLAALLVFVFHASLLYSPVPPHTQVSPYRDAAVADAIWAVVNKAGFVGVSFFFVLSGFVLTWSARPGDRVVAFWRRRILKIFPNHAVTWALAMVLFAGAVTPLSAWLPNLLMVHAFFPQGYIFSSVNPPAWSLCCELLFYLLFPFLIHPIRRIGDRWLWAWAGAMVAGMVGVQLVMQFLIPDEPVPPMSPVSIVQSWFGYIFPPMRLFEFVLGVFLARIVLAGRWPRGVNLAWAGVLMAAGYAAALAAPLLYGYAVATVVPIAAVICAAASVDVRGARTFLGGRVMRWLGEVSFGFYLAQGITLLYLRSLFHADGYGVPLGTLVLVCLFLATLLGGWLLHTCVERPIMRRWARTRPA
ncbi:acyltransferase [Actinomycetes bacterium KLBMP 9797]